MTSQRVRPGRWGEQSDRTSWSPSYVDGRSAGPAGKRGVERRKNQSLATEQQEDG